MPGTGPPIARRDPRRCKYLSGKGGRGRIRDKTREFREKFPFLRKDSLPARYISVAEIQVEIMVFARISRYHC